jgi:hypothetical protein
MKVCPKCFQHVTSGVMHYCGQKLLTGGRQIIISIVDGHGYAVTEGDLYTNELTFDEMLGQVVNLCHPNLRQPHYQMLTAEEWLEREKRWREK